MAISFILNDEAVNDQTAGTQTGDSGDGFTDTDVLYSSLPLAFRTYLESILSLISTFPENVGVATKTNSVTVNASDGGQLTNIAFTDGAGGALTGDPATDDSGLDTIDGKNILLVADGDDVVLGMYDSNGDTVLDAVAFVVFKQDSINTDGTQAQVTFHIVTYVPIDHPDDTDPDDAVDLGENLKLAAGESIVFDFDGTPSGKNLFTMVRANGVAVVVTNDTELTVLNTSKGGGPTTLGLFNQMIDPGEEMVFSFVKDPADDFTVPNLDQNEADDEAKIQFNGYETISGGSVIIAQVQGGSPASLTLKARIETDFTTGGDGFIDDYQDDTFANITRIIVEDGSGNVLVDTNNSLSGGGVTVNLSPSDLNWAFIEGLHDNYVVKYEAEPHQRISVRGEAGKFDIGGIGIDTPNSASEFVGQQIVIEDDGPTAAITDTGVDVVHDETTGVQDGTEPADVSDPTSDSGTDDDQLPGALPAAFPAGAIGWALSPGAVVNSNTSNFGTDGAGSTSWSLDVPGPNTDSGLVDLNGHKILLNVENGIVVGRVDDDAVAGVDGTDQIAIAILLDPSQRLAVAQYIPIGHVSDTGPDQVATMLDGALLAKLTVTDADGDPATITEPIGDRVKIEDDGPTAAITDTGVDVVHDENVGAQNTNTPAPGEDNDDDDQTDPLPPALSGVTNQGSGVTGWAKSASAVVSSTATAFGIDGPAAANSVVWSLDIAVSGTDSGFTDLNLEKILLYEETVGGQEVIVGRVSAGDNAGKAAIAIIIDQSGFLSVAQFLPLFHGDPTDPDDVETMLDGALLAKLTVTDGDGDPATTTLAIGDKVKIEDAGPTARSPQLGFVEEEHSAAGGELAGGNEDTVDGPPDEDADADTLADFGQTTNVKVTDLAALLIVNPGIDAPASFSLDGTKTGSLPTTLTSKGGTVSYSVTGDTLTAFVNGPTAGYQAAEDREVFTWQVTAAGLATFTLLDQLDNPAPASGAVEDILSIDLTGILVVKDKDLDQVSLSNGFAEYSVIDDVPIYKAQIEDGIVDFTTVNGPNPNDMGGTSVASVTNSLNGSVGTDENDAIDQSADGTKTYTFASATIVSSQIAGLKADISPDGATAWLFTDGEGGTTGVFDAASDTLWFKNVLDQDANGGAGSYTFTVEKDPAPSFTELDFADLPSGQNLHGTIAVDKADLTKGGLLLFPKNAVLNGDGTMSNTSPTTNTSKGGGAVTIGNSNQMFDPGEGHYFIYVDNPVAASVAGAGLDQNNADDADTIGFDGLNPQTTAQVEVVQVQGGGTASFKITAYDFTFSGGAVDSDNEARDLVTDPLAANASIHAPTGAAEVNITRIQVSDSGGALILDSDAALSGGGVTINLGGNTAEVTGLDDNYTVEWTTASPHDGVLIEGTGGKYDLGGFNLVLEQPSEDQQFDFSIRQTDYDGDVTGDLDGDGVVDIDSTPLDATDTGDDPFAFFSIGVDGTGVNDNDDVLLV